MSNLEVGLSVINYNVWRWRRNEKQGGSVWSIVTNTMGCVRKRQTTSILAPWNLMFSFPSHFFSSQWGNYFNIHYLPKCTHYKRLHVCTVSCSTYSISCMDTFLNGYYMVKPDISSSFWQWKNRKALPKEQHNEFFLDFHFSNAGLLNMVVDGKLNNEF